MGSCCLTVRHTEEKMRGLLTVMVVAVMGLCEAKSRGAMSEEAARDWVRQYNLEAQTQRYSSVMADWNYNTNLTDYNQRRSLEQKTVLAEFDNRKADEANTFDWRNFEDGTLSREFSKIADKGSAVLPEDRLTRLNGLRAEMQRIYSTARVCNKPGDDSGRCYPLDPDLTQIFAASDDWDELVWAWQGWREESGAKMPDMYEEFVGLLNEAATLNGYDDNGDNWRSWYEDESFREACETLWQQLRPLYEQLHAYVLRKLKQQYPEGTFPSEGHIPAHLLGNMWAQGWNNIERFVRPFPNRQGVDVTDELQRQGYNATGLFVLSEEFFTSLGLERMPSDFWRDSLIVKPDDREVVCHASAWDFYNQRDFRIKQCTEITMNWLITTHHEMGHVIYFLLYKDQPVKFRGGANPGFHEAIGDVMALSVSTPEHLAEIGLLPNFEDDPEVDINFLMNQALKKIAFIPFGYLIDQWRWDLFDGSVDKSEYNRRWWEYRCRYQGVSPPVARGADDFDGGAKYHVPGNTPYIRYFVSHILQFQFQKSLCDAAGHDGPLHRCDIYRSTDAGKLIGDMMKLGSSMPWQDALEAMTGSREMSAEPLVEYFQPLLRWLEDQNEGEPIGWDSECPQGTVP